MAELTAAVERLPTSDGLVVVLDLDATVWLPEVYTLRAPRGAADDWTPTLGTDVRVLPGAAAVLKLLAARPDTQVAVASRSAKPEWSKALLAKVPDLAAAAVHIYPGDKRTHLRRIAKGLGCAFSRMVLFDDARDGKHGNCVGAAALGVLAVHCPQGLNEERWRAGLAAFEKGVRGKVIDAPGGPAPSKPTVTLPAVSLAMPFAARRQRRKIATLGSARSRGKLCGPSHVSRSTQALLLNGFKTLETRNNELFAPYEGRRVVVRVGMKDWDNASWKLWHPAGAADLRPGFRRGDAAGVVDVGETRRLAPFDDAAPRACACVEDCGTFGTVVSNAKWFPRPWRVRGFPGVVDLAVPADLVGGAAAAAARAAGPPAIDAAAAPAKKTGNRRQRRARLQSGPGAAA